MLTLFIYLFYFIFIIFNLRISLVRKMILPQESKLAYLNWKYWNKNVNYIFYKLESWLAAIKMCRSTAHYQSHEPDRYLFTSTCAPNRADHRLSLLPRDKPSIGCVSKSIPFPFGVKCPRPICHFPRTARWHKTHRQTPRKAAWLINSGTGVISNALSFIHFF